jgi:SAM-dependent methyltransferase
VNKRIFLFLLPLMLVGCGSPSGEAPVAEQPIELPDPNGFFTELTRFTDIDDWPHIFGKSVNDNAVRMNYRFDRIITPFKDRIKGARVLDFGSFDGRWTHALISAAGAEHVTGIEIDPSFVARAETNLQELGVPADKYDFIIGDIMDALETIEPGSYDGVLLAGVFYHITYHVELIEKLKQLDIKWIIMDSTIASDERPIVLWVEGKDGFNGLEGVPSRRAVEVMAEAAGYKYEYVPVDHLTSPLMWNYRMGNQITMLIYE